MEQPTFGLESVCRVQEKSPSDSVKSGMGQRVTFVGGNQGCLVSTGDAGASVRILCPEQANHNRFFNLTYGGRKVDGLYC